jgi:hypothetical protein
MLIHSCTNASRSSCSASGGFWRGVHVYRVHPINVQLVTDPVIMPAKDEHVKYRDDILDPIVLLFLQQRNFDHVFQHCNARCHVVRVCQDFLNLNHICVLPLPALSPDLSPIAHLWDELGRRVLHVKIHRKHYRSCVTHLCTSGTTCHKPLSNDSLVLKEHRCDSGSESLDKHEPRDILHCNVERRDQSFAVAERAER